MKKMLFLCACMAAPALTMAASACEGRMVGWAKALAPGRAADANRAVCKPWPADPALTLAAIPLPTDASAGKGEADLLLLVANSQSGAVVAHLLQPSVLNDDGGASEIALDTARYQLTPASRAFGVRAYSGSMSRMSPYNETTLSLYVVAGAQLRQVLTDLVVSTSTGNWDEVCNGEVSRTTVAVSLGAAGSEGYAALELAEQSVASMVAKCVEKTGPVKRAKRTLNYRAGQYQ